VAVAVGVAAGRGGQVTDPQKFAHVKNAQLDEVALQVNHLIDKVSDLERRLRGLETAEEGLEG
jgi:hypothetical protein